MSNFIIDPITRDKVNIHTTRGKTILKKYIKSYKNGGFWPFTKKVSQDVIDKYSPIELFFKTRGDLCDQDLKDITNYCDNNILETLFDLKSAKEVGKGAYGSVSKICYNKAIKSLYRKNTCYALKVMEFRYYSFETGERIKNNDANFKNEIAMQCNFSKIGFAPKIYAAWKCEKNEKDVLVHNYYIIMELVKPIKRRLTRKDGIYFFDKLEEAKSIGLLHVDTHPGNIALKNNKIILIDFGWAVKLGDGEGENKDRYPMHPSLDNWQTKIDGIIMLLDKGMSWDILELMQDQNVNHNFHKILPVGTPDNEKKDAINMDNLELYIWYQTLLDLGIKLSDLGIKLSDGTLDLKLSKQLEDASLEDEARFGWESLTIPFLETKESETHNSYYNDLKNYRPPSPWKLSEDDWKLKIKDWPRYYGDAMLKIKSAVKKYKKIQIDAQRERLIKQLRLSDGALESKREGI